MPSPDLRDDILEAFKTSSTERSDTSNDSPATTSNDRAPSVDKSTTERAVPEAKRETKPETKPEAKPAEAKPSAEAPAAEKPIDPPARWTKEEKEEFASLDPRIQKILLGRNKGLEADYTRKAQEVAQERQRLGQLETILAPRREEWKRHGLDDTRALDMVLGYWDFANRDPVGFIQNFAQQRNLDLSRYYAPNVNPGDLSALQHNAGDPNGAGTDGQGGAALHPAVLQVLEQMATEQMQLKEQLGSQGQYLQQYQQQQYQSTYNSAASEYTKFVGESDEHGQPLRPFFEDVRQDMAKLMQSGLSDNLQDAYDRAVWSRPDLRAKISENERLSWRRQEESRRREEAEKAKRAGASVTASSVSYTPPPSSDGSTSLRDEIRNALDATRQRARV